MSENLDLYNKVRQVPEIAKKKIGGGRLNGMTDINPMWRIKILTENFGICGVGWYYEVIDKQTIINNDNNEMAVFVDIKLYIKINNEWSNPIFGTGGSTVIANEKGGLRLNDEAFKMATTDAISVACKQLGIGADVYWDKDNTKYTNNNIDKPKPIVQKELSENEVEIMKAKAEADKEKNNLLLEKYKGDIRISRTLKELEPIGVELKNAKLPPEIAIILRKEYTEKLNLLKANSNEI